MSERRLVISEDAYHQALGSLTTYLEALGVDLNDEVLRDTPRRMLDGHLELLAGTSEDPAAVLADTFPAGHEEMVMVRNLQFSSICEHHFLPFMGRAQVAYIPNASGRITGLSKIARLVEVLSSRMQVQERLTTQIAEAIEEALNPRGVLVVVEAEHLCMSLRGVRSSGARAVTSAVRGAFRQDPSTRAEAISLMGIVQRD